MVGNPRHALPNKTFPLGRQPPVNPGQTLGQRQHVINDRVTHITVEIAQLGFRFAIDRDAEGCDALRLCLAQSFARVFACVTGVAVIVIVRTTVGQDDQ